MLRLALLAFLFYFAIAPVTGETAFTGIMDKYLESDWQNLGATVIYNASKGEVAVRKDLNYPSRAGAILFIGQIDPSDDIELRFNVLSLSGSYALLLHYGKPDKYDEQYIVLQEDAFCLGPRSYNLSEALRLHGFSKPQDVAIHIMIGDPEALTQPPQLGLMRLEDFSIGSP